MPNKRAANKHARKRAQREFGGQARAWFPGKGRPLMVVPSKRYLLRRALEGVDSLTLRKGGGHPKRILSRARLGLADIYTIGHNRKGDRSFAGRVFDKRHPAFNRELINKVVALLKGHGYLAEEPVWDKARPNRMVSYRAGHTLGELWLAFPKRFKRLATPETAEKLADLIGLLWKNKLTYGHLHNTNIVYFKGKLGLIDWKWLAPIELDFTRAKPAEIVARIRVDIIPFTRVLFAFATSNPEGWPQQREQREAIYRRMLEHLPVPAETRAAVLQWMILERG